MPFPGNNFATPDAAADALLSSVEAISGVSIGSKLNMDGVVLYCLANLFDQTAGNSYFSPIGAGYFSGNITLTAAATKIIPGATSLTFRNNADSQSNIAITDAGAITVRSTIGGVTTLTATTVAATTLTATTITGAGAITSSSPSAGIGYATGAGGTIGQGAGSGKATGFTLSKLSGQITTDNAQLNAGVIVSATWTNTTIAATDTVIINHVSGGTVGSYGFNVQCGAGTATLNIRNNTAGNLTEALVLQFNVVKGVTA